MAAMNTLIFPVKDADGAKAFYSALVGAEPSTDSPYYVGYSSDGQEIGLDPNGHAQGLPGPVAYWDVEDINAAMRRLLDAGGTSRGDVRDVGGGKLIATVADPDGNVIGLMQSA